MCLNINSILKHLDEIEIFLDEKKPTIIDLNETELDSSIGDYLLTNWLAYLYRRIQSPRPDVMPDRREGITRAAGFVFACIDTQAS